MLLYSSAFGFESQVHPITRFRQSCQIRKGASFFQINLAVLAGLLQYPWSVSSSFLFECEQTFHCLCLPPFDFILDAALQDQCSLPKQKTLHAGSAVLLHVTLHGASLLLQIFTSLHQALLALCIHSSKLSCVLPAWLKVSPRIFKLLAKGILCSSSLIESLSHNLDFSRMAVCVASWMF